MSPSLLLAVALVVGDAVASALPTTAGEPGSVARAKCQEYSDAVFAKGKAEPADQCLPGYNIPDNGNNEWFAEPKEFPHMAHIGYEDASWEALWQCGGSLISPNFVLTSVSCLTSPSHGAPRWVRLGAVSLRNGTTGDKPQVIGVDKIFRHPDYKVTEVYNDIALLRLERPAELSDFVRPACVNTEPTLDPAVVPVTTGWGLTELLSGDPSETLKKVPFALVDYAKCSKAYAELNPPRMPLGIVDASHVCAGGDDKADTCQGDTGGPLQVPTRGAEPRCMHKVVGITSFGKACFTTAPGVYTRVSYFVPWIESIVWPGH